MSSRFNWKSLAFYGIATSSVVVLFSVTTTYGEANLQAPDPIGGTYPLDGNRLAGCLEGQDALLTIQQSGMYLTGSILPADVDPPTTRMATDRPSLNGTWKNQQLNLSGSLTYLGACTGNVQVQGAIADTLLTGEIQLEGTPEAVKFTSQRLETPIATMGGH